jgi:hypothetical protein
MRPRYGCPSDAASEMADERQTWTRARFVVVAAVAALYAPAVVARFGFYDDFMALVASAEDPGAYTELTISYWRPLHGLLIEAGFAVVDSVDGLRWLRALALLGVAVTGLTLVEAARCAGFRPYASAAIALAVTSMPAVYVLATWAIASWQVLALAAGVYAGLLVCDDRGRSPLGGMVLLAASLAVYQPSGLAAVAVIVLVVVGRPDMPVPWRRGLAIGAGGVVLYGFLAAVTIHLGDVPGTDRTALTVASMGPKLRWAIGEPLYRTLDPLAFDPRGPVALLVALLLGVGLWLALQEASSRGRLGRLALVIGAWVFTCSPMLAVVENFPSNRARLANQVLFVCTAALAARGYRSLVPSARLLAAAAPAALLLPVWVLAAFRLDQYIVSPRVKELRLVEEVADALPEGGTVQVVPSKNWQSLGPGVSFDELGALTTASPPAAVAIMRLALGPTSKVWAVDALPQGVDGVDFGSLVAAQRHARNTPPG